jgi:hypothetical protein
MTPVKYFVAFGILVASIVLLAQTALGASSPAAAKPAAAKPTARVSTFQPERTNAQGRVAAADKPTNRANRIRPGRSNAQVDSPSRMHVQISPFGRMRATGASAQGPRR